MKAIIHIDAFNDFGAKELIKDLLILGFQVKTIHNLSEINLLSWKHNITLYYRTPQIRIPDPVAVYQYHATKSQVSYLVCMKGECISVNWDLIDLNQNYIVGVKNSYFFLTNVVSTTILDDFETPLLILFTKQRYDLFEITFKSLKFSLGEDFKNHKVAILLNDNNSNTKKVADNISNENPNVEILLPDSNAGNSSINLVLQYYKSLGIKYKNFVICEDDFILPTTVRPLYPNWTRQFARKLENFDLVGWGVGINNRPIENYIPIRNGDTILKFNYHYPDSSSYKNMWITSFEEKLPLGAQALAVSTEFYKTCAYNRKDYSPCDEDLLSSARSYILPKILGYHIGWDQEILGYASLLTPGKWPTPEQKNAITFKGKKTDFILSDILNY